MVKRIFDLVIACTLLITMSPFIILVALLVRCFLGSPVFFRQNRPGLHGKVFQIIKFRTMREIDDAQGDVGSDSARMTRLGKFLRSSSLDELPELWNVIKGEMSIVGPRPLLVEYLPLYNETQKRRHEVKPGITGLTQIKGRNALAWEDKFDLDVWYIDNRSLWLDIKIVLMTVQKVLAQEGITSKGSVTAEKFAGNKDKM